MYTIKQRTVPLPLESANASRSKNGDIKLGCVHKFLFISLSWELWQESTSVTYCTSIYIYIYIHICKHNVAIIVDYQWKNRKSILGFKLVLFDRDERNEITEAHCSLVSFCILSHVVTLVSPSLLSFLCVCSLSLCLFSSLSYMRKKDELKPNYNLPPNWFLFFYVVGSDVYWSVRVLLTGNHSSQKAIYKFIVTVSKLD